MPNETEAKSLTCTEYLEELRNRLKSKVEAFAIKLGRDEALGVHWSQKVKLASNPVTVVDSVGAGD